MKNLYRAIATLLITSTLSSIAFGDTVLRPGETLYITSSQYVSCSGAYNPGPMPQPTPPPPPPKFRVDVRPNYSCLYAIQNTDGRSLAKAALRCDNSNPEKSNIAGRKCDRISAEEDQYCSTTVLNKKTTVIHDDQENTVRTACTRLMYMCEY